MLGCGAPYPGTIARILLALEVSLTDLVPDMTNIDMLLRDKSPKGREKGARKIIIGVNKSHHPNRRRFTIAHEIGHLVLHKGEMVHLDSGIAFAFDREDRQAHANSYTFYLRYTGPLPGGNDVKVDITINELVVFPLIERVVLRGYEEFSDLPENRSIFVYSLDEIATEKTMALADPARNGMGVTFLTSS